MAKVMTVQSLSSVQLPHDAALRRDPPPQSLVKDPDRFWDNYDSKTLIYDCVHDPDRQTLTLYAPKAYNLKSVFDSATFRLDGKDLGPGKWASSRHLDCVTFAGITSAGQLAIDHPAVSAEVSVNHADDDCAGRNVLYTMSRNNDLAWIRDWAQYHCRMHGADAVVVCDNGSDAYTVQDIAAALHTVPGLQVVKVVSAPLPFGPRDGDCTRWSDAKFLQAAMMNLCKDRFMAKARVILNLDVDELVVSSRGESIFDATAASWFGHITFPGVWRHATERNATHRDHIHIKAGDPPCPSKYTLRPTSFLARFPMQVHSLHQINRKLFLQPKRFHFLHCRNISTSWKIDRRPDDAHSLTVDPIAQQALETAFTVGQ